MKLLKHQIKKSIDYLATRIAAKVATGVVERQERLLLAHGRQLAHWSRGLQNLASITDAEFRIFSEYGDDGIIQYLTSHLDCGERTCIEFGVENYTESNTRFLVMNDLWSGFVMDGSPDAIQQLRQSYYYWRHDLTAEAAFITAENINTLLGHRTFGPVGLLHIDLDGNDYWIWKAIEGITPAVVIVEYNSVFGTERAITIPYAADFHRAKAHSSRLYFGASLPAFALLAEQKGYAFIGSNSAGNNAYFVRTDLLNEHVRPVSIQQGYRVSKFRESCGADGQLTFLAGDERQRPMRGMPVLNVVTNQLEKF